MAEIFLSYANEDREAARKVAALLETAGWSVWWDRRVRAGQTWHSMIENALREMRCMVVLWSAQSIESDWVKEEAEEARAMEKLVPVLIEPVRPPVGFRAIQAADLVDWDGDSKAGGAVQLIADLEARLGKPVGSSAGRSAEASEKTRTVLESQIDRERSGNLGTALTGGRGTAESGATEQSGLAGEASGVRIATIPRVAAVSASLIALLIGGWLWLVPPPTPAPQPPSTEPVAPKARPAPRLVSLTVSGDRAEIKTEDTLALSLTGHYDDGRQDDISERVEWISSDPGVAAVDARGLVKARRPGSAQITARYGDISSPPWTLKVQVAAQLPKPQPPNSLIGLVIGGEKQELGVNEKILLRVTASYSDGSKKGLSKGVSWQSTDARVASINARGELEALRPGKLEVRAKSGEVESPPLRIVVKEAEKRAPVEPLVPAPVDAVKMSPPRVAVDKIKLSAYLSRAKSYREQGNYGAALAELERARSMDLGNPEIGKEIEQTKRACNAEKNLGRSGLEC